MTRDFIRDHWINIEDQFPQPSILRNIVEMESTKFLEIIKNLDKTKIEEIITNLYSGDFYIFKKALTKDYLEGLKNKLVEFSINNPSTFHKIIENCPNFHRIQDEKTLGNYSIDAIRHSYYFFRWGYHNSLAD